MGLSWNKQVSKVNKGYDTQLHFNHQPRTVILVSVVYSFLFVIIIFFQLVAKNSEFCITEKLITVYLILFSKK